MNFRLELLKVDPRQMSDRDLAMAGTFLLAERKTIGVRRVDAVIRELHRRGMPEIAISRLTGFGSVVVFRAVHGRPPRLEMPKA